jgi:hypothetical protein
MKLGKINTPDEDLNDRSQSRAISLSKVTMNIMMTKVKILIPKK